MNIQKTLKLLVFDLVNLFLHNHGWIVSAPTFALQNIPYWVLLTFLGWPYCGDTSLCFFLLGVLNLQSHRHPSKLIEINGIKKFSWSPKPPSWKRPSKPMLFAVWIFWYKTIKRSNTNRQSENGKSPLPRQCKTERQNSNRHHHHRFESFILSIKTKNSENISVQINKILIGPNFAKGS